MDTCVLIPAEVSLVLRPHPDPTHILEMAPTIWANLPLPPGTCLPPDQGLVKLDKLHVYRSLPKDDIRHQYGLTDEVFPVEGVEVRHCNWVRFLQEAPYPDRANVECIRVKDDVIIRVIKPINTNEELQAFFHHDDSKCNTATAAKAISTDLYYMQKPLEVQVCTPAMDLRVNVEDFSDMEAPRSPLSSISSASPRSLPSPTAMPHHSLPSPTIDERSRSPEIPRSPLLDVVATPGVSEASLPSPSTRTTSTPHPASRGDVNRMVPGMERAMVRHAYSVVPGYNGSWIGQQRSPGSEDDDCRSTISEGSVGSDDSQIEGGNSESPRIATLPVNFPVQMQWMQRQQQQPAQHPTIPSLPAVPEHNLPAPAAKRRERTWLPCQVCGKKFDRPSLLNRHMRTHTGEKPHACDVCGKAFSTSSSLNTHRRIHSGEKPHVCPICGKRFTASSNLYYHRMTHKKEKPHKCNMCSKSFPTPGDLKSHMYVHNGSWPFRCDICNRGFSKQTNLKNHKMLHTGEKPHNCDLCGKKFALQCNLKTHMKTHQENGQEERRATDISHPSPKPATIPENRHPATGMNQYATPGSTSNVPGRTLFPSPAFSTPHPYSPLIPTPGMPAPQWAQMFDYYRAAGLMAGFTNQVPPK